MKRRGFTLIEVIFTMSLTAVAMTMATRLLGSVLNKEAEITRLQRQSSQIDQAVHRLRIDLEKAAVIQINGTSLQLDGIRWASGTASLTRATGTQVEQFDSPGVTPQFSVEACNVTLRIGDAAWALPTPAMMMKDPK